MVAMLRLGLLALLLGLMLSACESEKMQETHLSMQQNYFIQSVELVENAGIILQSAELKQEDIDRAMQQLDKGMQQAFNVERDFLERLDLRLPKHYRELFIPGIEQYRLGVAAADRKQQLQGLELLSRWGQFWLQEQDNIRKKMVQMRG